MEPKVGNTTIMNQVMVSLNHVINAPSLHCNTAYRLCLKTTVNDVVFTHPLAVQNHCCSDASNRVSIVGSDVPLVKRSSTGTVVSYTK